MILQILSGHCIVLPLRWPTNKMAELSSKIYRQIKLETFKIIRGKLESTMLMFCTNSMFGGLQTMNIVFLSFYWPLPRPFQWLSQMQL